MFQNFHFLSPDPLYVRAGPAVPQWVIPSLASLHSAGVFLLPSSQFLAEAQILALEIYGHTAGEIKVFVSVLYILKFLEYFICPFLTSMHRISLRMILLAFNWIIWLQLQIFSRGFSHGNGVGCRPRIDGRQPKADATSSEAGDTIETIARFRMTFRANGAYVFLKKKRAYHENSEKQLLPLMLT